MLEISKNILQVFNDMDTIWKNTFYITTEEVEPWTHVSGLTENYSLTISTTKEITNEDDYKYAFRQWGPKENYESFSQMYKNELIDYLFEKLSNDFSIAITPILIHVYIHKFHKNYKRISVAQSFSHNVCEFGAKPTYIMFEKDNILFAHDNCYVFSLIEEEELQNNSVYTKFKEKIYSKIYHDKYDNDKDYKAMFDRLYKKQVEDKEEQLTLF